MHDMNKKISDSPFLLLLFILGIINYIIRKHLEEKVNTFLRCQSIKACKPKNVVLRYKIMSKCVEGDSCLQKPTGIRRHRLRALFGGGDEGNTLEQTD